MPSSESKLLIMSSALLESPKNWDSLGCMPAAAAPPEPAALAGAPAGARFERYCFSELILPNIAC